MNIDSSLSTTSENPLQNKAIYNALNSITNGLEGKQNTITIVSESNFSEPSVLNTGEIILVYEE